MSDASLVTQLITALTLLASCLIGGLVFEKIILIKLKALADRTKWECDEIIVCALRGRVVRWFFIIGFYSAISVLPLPDDVLRVVHNVLLVLFMLAVTAAVANIAVGIVNVYAKKAQVAFHSTSIFTNFTIMVVFVTGILIIMQSLGISITPLLTALGVGGLAVALALQETLSNFFAGLHILVSGPIKPGDYIKLDTGEEGYVIDITWRNTSIKALLDNMIIVPNAKMASARIINYSLPCKEMVLVLPLGVSYGSDLAKVEQVTVQVAKEVMAEVPGGVREYKPMVRFKKFGEFSIQFNVILRAKEYADQYLIRHEFIKRLHQRYRLEGIEIPYPVRTVYVRQDSTTDSNKTVGHK